VSCVCCQQNPVCVCVDPLPEAGQYTPNLNPEFGAQYVANTTGRTRVPRSITVTISGLKNADQFWFFFNSSASCPADIDITALNRSYIFRNGAGGCSFSYALDETATVGGFPTPGLLLPGIIDRTPRHLAMLYMSVDVTRLPVAARFQIGVLGCNANSSSFIVSDWATWIRKVCTGQTVTFTQSSPHSVTVTLSPNPLP